MSKVEICPNEVNCIYDLLVEAGMDTQMWGIKRNGEEVKNIKSNPAYCYNWSFVENDKIVINLWYNEIDEEDGVIFIKINIVKLTEENSKNNSRDARIARAKAMDQAIRKSFESRFPIRPIILRKDQDKTYRILDNTEWWVNSYNNGDAVIQRGVEPAADQFDILEGQEEGSKVCYKGEKYKRDPIVRRKALLRAGGKCELCGKQGFSMENGGIYLETHHIVPLAEEGVDSIENVIALCPNDHRKAHFGKGFLLMRDKLKDIIG